MSLEYVRPLRMGWDGLGRRQEHFAGVWDFFFRFGYG